MAGRFLDLIGTVYSRIRIGLSGPSVAAESGEVAARNAADTDYAAIRASLVRVFGDDIELNAGASGAGADWIMTLARPDTGMANDLRIVLPPGNPSPGQALTVANYSAGVVTLTYTTVAAGDDKVMVDTTTLNFDSSSPLAMFTKPANAIVVRQEVIIDTPFDGTPSLSIGIAGDTSKYLGATQVNLTESARTVFEVNAGRVAPGGTEDMIATYAANGATVGIARLLTYYTIPA